MPEQIHFKSPEEIKEESIQTKIKEKGAEGEILGGIVFDEEKDPETGQEKKFIYIGNPYEADPTIIKIETEASKEDIAQIKKEIIPMKESFEILEACATTYKLRQPLLMEGPTATGKTYLTEKFTELLYGRGTRPLDFYCSGQTDVSELMAKWVPRVESEQEQKKWNEFIESVEAQEKLSQIAQEVEQKQNLSQERKLAFIHSKLAELAKSVGLAEKTQWRFQYGAVPKAMGLTRSPDGTFSFDEQKGAGFTLHIEEVGLAEPQVINALLKLRGKRGKIAEEIQLWENGGKKVQGGPKFWAVFSTNPPEEYLARNEVDPALARGMVFKRMGELSEESLRLAAEYYFTYRLGEKPKEKPEGCILDIYNDPEIGRQIAALISSFHNDFNKELKKGEKGRTQRIPLTLDDMARTAEYLARVQLRKKETGHFDLPQTLTRAVNLYYLDRLADQELKEDMIKNFKEILTGDTGKINFEGELKKRAEVLDLLVERASLTEEDKKRLEEATREEEKRKAEKARAGAKDALDDLLKKADIPEAIKKMLK